MGILAGTNARSRPVWLDGPMRHSRTGVVVQARGLHGLGGMKPNPSADRGVRFADGITLPLANGIRQVKGVFTPSACVAPGELDTTEPYSHGWQLR